jgi:para-nitrobenzyl esterase
LAASPLAKNLFQKAIGESGAVFTNGNSILQKAEDEGTKITQSLNASSISDLRAIAAEDLMEKVQGFRGPIIDGYVLPDAIVNIFNAGKENTVSLLTGWNEDEGIMFGPVKNAEDFKKDAEKNYGADVQTFLQFYPATTDEEAATSQLKLSRDQIFGAQNYTWANIQSSQGSKVYVYRFTRKVPGTGQYAKYGAFHTGEVPYAYDNLQFVHRPWEQVDHQLATTMSSYWANFIKTGDPNGNRLPEWDTYKTTDKKIMNLGVKPGSETIPDAAPLDFLYEKMIGK